MVIQDNRQDLGYVDEKIFPKDWKFEKLGKLFNLKSGSTPSRKNSEFFKGGIYWITSTDLNRNFLMNTIEKISLEAVKRTNLKIFPENTFVIALYGLEAEETRGNCGITTMESTINQACMSFRKKDDVESEYLYYFYLLFGNKIALTFAQGTKQQNLYKNVLEMLIIPFPSPLEQQKIIQKLSEISNLIQKLGKLIEKKKNIMKGTTQTLLSGTKRLGKFTDEWEIKELKKIVKIKKGQMITNKTSMSGEIPVIGGGKTSSYTHNTPNRFHKTITISASGANAGYVSFHTYPIFASDCSTIEEGEDYVIEFIYFQLKLIQNQIYYSQTGGNQPHVQPKELYSFKIPLPKSKNEQSMISELLMDMNSEILNLENQHEKYQKIKQGMMQKLLTGEIRLV
jgi:type I restriction enzyme, S subunit